MENNLYLLEVFIEKIELTPSCTNDLANEDVMICAEVGANIKMEIECLNRPLSDYKNSKLLVFNCGKSSLFATEPEKLKKMLTANPLKLGLFLQKSRKASVTVPWKNDIYNSISKPVKKGAAYEPYSFKNSFKLLADGGKHVADIGVLVKLQFFGSNLQTTFQLLETTGNTHNKYLIKGAEGPTTFQFQRQEGNDGSSSEMVPLMPFAGSIYMQSVDNMTTTNKVAMDMSFMALFNPEFDTKKSFAMKTDPSINTFDIVSLMGRPDENKFVDLRIRGGSQGYIFEFEQMDGQKVDQFGGEGKKHKSDIPSMSVSDNEIEDELTAENINKLLCKNKDCPAAKKFKELGLGPLAKEKCLGSAYLDAAPYRTYGLSQTYGVFDDYGPYGLFSRPKRPEQPFIGKKDEDANWGDACWTPKRKKSAKKPSEDEEYCCSMKCEPLRLTGGGIFDYENVKSPLFECQEMMQQFDEVLEKYKKALGPCGNVTCPYAPNIVAETCKNTCHSPGDYKLEDLPPCQQPDAPVCPAMEKKRARLPLGACGSPKCAYAQYKTRLPDEDAIMELQFMPTTLTGKCGQPQCPFLIQPELPPIHWDCPDPLPAGTCKNPNCPFLPPDLKCLSKVVPKSSPLCGNPDCPYAVPPPCDSPTCPFNSKECPYAQTQQKQDECSICENPDCPYNLEAAPSDELCDNPDCPYAKPPEEELGSLCGNSDCPYVIAERAKKPCYEPPPQPCRPPPPTCPAGPPCQPICPSDPCSYLAMILQYIFKAYNLCPDSTCPYPMKDLMDVCLGGPECPLVKNKAQKQPVEESKKQGVCAECGGGGGGGEASSLGEDHPVIVTVGDRDENEDTAPCTPQTCVAGVCDECCRSKCDREDSFLGEDNPVIVTIGDRDETEDTAPCSPKTCGTLVCDECCRSKSDTGGAKQAGGASAGQKDKSKSDPGLGKRHKKKKKGKKQRSKYVYAIGDKYPGIQIGHKECVMPCFNVPARMGWLWNIHTPCMQLKPRRGWRPGAVGRTMAATIRKHHEAKGLKTLELKSLRRGGKRYGEYGESTTSVNVKPKPTLQIKKKDGCYWITMNPLKDPKTLVENENPYMDCTPMQFKIVKNKEPKVKNDGDSEFRSCFCGEDEELLQESSSESELDIEFTPPAGLIHPERFRRKKNVVHCDTQYATTDFEPPKTKDDKKGKKGKKGKKDKKGKGGKKGKKGKGKKKK